MKIIRNYRRKKLAKFRAEIHRQYRKEYKEKLEKIEQFHIAENMNLITKNKKETESLHEFYKTEINTVRTQEAAKWKALLDERDSEIEKLRNEKDDRKESYKSFAQIVQDFEEMCVAAEIQYTAAGNYINKGQQKLLTGFNQLNDFKLKYNKIMPKTIDQIKEK